MDDLTILKTQIVKDELGNFIEMLRQPEVKEIIFEYVRKTPIEVRCPDFQELHGKYLWDLLKDCQ